MSAMRHFSPFATSTWQMLAFLGCGLDGKISVTITASKRGLSLRIGRTLMAHGKDADALVADYERNVERTRAELATMKP